MADQDDASNPSFDPSPSDSLGSHGVGAGPVDPAQDVSTLDGLPHRFAIGEVGDGLSVSDGHDVVVFANDRLREMLGCERGELVGQPVTAFLSVPAVDPSDAASTPCPQRDLFPQRALLRRKDGSLVEVVLDRQPLVDSQGQPLGTLDVVMDVTEKTRIEQAILDNAAWHRLIVDNLNHVFWVAEIEDVERAGSVGRASAQQPLNIKGLLRRWRFTYVSSSFERLFGYPFTTIATFSPYDAVPEAFHEVVEEQLTWYINQAMNDPEGVSIPDTLVLPLVTSTGASSWCETTARVLHDGPRRLLRFVGVTRDVTDTHLAEEAIRASEEKMRAICDAAQDAVIVMDADGRAVHWNTAAERMFGYRAEEVLGRDVHALLTPRRLHEQIRRGVEQFRHSGEGPVVGNVIQSEAVRKDGSEFPVEIAVSPLVVEGRRAAVGIVRDVTDRTLAEEAVRCEQRRLARLLDAYEGHRKMATYEIHDGVAQPLVSALMTLDAFSQVRGPCPDALWSDYDRAVAVLREALAETRRLMSGMRPHVLDELGVVTALDHLIREHRVAGTATIEYYCDVSFQRLAPPLETMIFRIVQEGLVNAQRHSQTKKIRVEFVEQQDHVRIVVEDWGIGFNPADVPEDHFGLEGIRERAAATGGHARIDTTPGKGTRIQVDLPLIQEES